MSKAGNVTCCGGSAEAGSRGRLISKYYRIGVASRLYVAIATSYAS